MPPMSLGMAPWTAVGANAANWTGGLPASNTPVFAAVGAGNLSNGPTANTSVAGLKFNNDGGSVTVNVGTSGLSKMLTLANGGTVTVAAGSHIIDGPVTTAGSTSAEITLAGASTWNIAIGASLTVSARTYRASTANFTKTGGGLFVMDNDNSGSGATKLNWLATDGTLRFTSTGALGVSTAPVTVSNGASVEMANGAGLQKGTLTLNGIGVGGTGAYHVLSGAAVSHSDSALGSTVLAASSTIAVDNGASLNMTRAISESGTGSALTKIGEGTMKFSAANTYTGATNINAGTLSIGASGTILSPAVSIASGATFDVSEVSPFALSADFSLAGSGSVNGSVVDGSGTKIRPGGAGVVGELTFNNNLDLSGNGSVEFDIASISSADKVVLTGDLTPSGVTPLVIDTQPPGGLSTGASYNLFEVTGTLGGTTANFSLLNKTRSALSLSYASNNVVLTVDTGVAPQSLIWSGGVGGSTWGVNTTANWNSGTEKFFLFDTVSFTDAGVANNIVDLTEALAPTAVTVDSSGNYQFSGTGSLTGITSLTKAGAGDLTVSTANDYSGDTTINAGKIILGVAGAIPSGAGKGNLTLGGGTLDVAGFSITANNLSGSGTIDNSGAASTLTFRQTTETTFSGLISNTGSSLSLVCATVPRLTLSGVNNTFTGTTNIGISGTGTRIGTLRAAASGALGTSTVSIGPGGNDATAAFELSGGITLGNAISLPARTSPETGIRNLSGTNTLSNTITLNSGGSWWVVASDGGTLKLSGTPALTVGNTGTRTAVLKGSGNIEVTGVIQNGVAGAILNLQKEGGGTATLSAANTYTGNTTVVDGTLVITQDDVLADASTVTLASSSSLNLTHSGTDTVTTLVIGGVSQPNGVYTFGTGKLKVGISTPFEDWAILKGLDGTTGKENGPAADPDKDGSSNLAEFAFNGDPLSGSDNGQIHVLTADSDADTPDTAKELILTLAVRKTTPAFTAGAPATAPLTDGVNYSIHGSTDLASFGVIVTPVGFVDPGVALTDATNYEYRSFSLNGSNGLAGKGFLRAKAEAP